MKQWLVLFALPLTLVAQAETLKFSWVAPTERINGVVLKPEEIKEYEIRHGSTPEEGKYTSLLKTDKLAAQTTVAKPGKYCYQIRVIAIDAASDWSPEACTTVTPSKPKPINLKVDD